MGIHERERVQHKVQEGVSHYVQRDVICSAEHQRIVVAKIPHVGNSPYQRFDNDVELPRAVRIERSEEHTSELQSRLHLVCRLLLEKKNITPIHASPTRQASTSTSFSKAAHTNTRWCPSSARASISVLFHRDNMPCVRARSTRSGRV